MLSRDTMIMSSGTPYTGTLAVAVWVRLPGYDRFVVTGDQTVGIVVGSAQAVDIEVLLEKATNLTGGLRHIGGRRCRSPPRHRISLESGARRRATNRNRRRGRCRTLPAKASTWHWSKWPTHGFSVCCLSPPVQPASRATIGRVQVKLWRHALKRLFME